MEKTKHYFKGKSPEETELWIRLINKYTLNLQDNLKPNKDVIEEIDDQEGPLGTAGSSGERTTE